MTSDKTGRIVWHDLFTDNPLRSRSFYERVAGWHYVIEHATDFAWGGGERDFILALCGDEAGAGFVQADSAQFHGWIPYVEVQDVDSAAEIAVGLGGIVEKAPFEVPGVGRNCLLRDPNGALVGISLSRHGFPAPTRQFGPETYHVRVGEYPEEFYRALFDWSILPSECAEKATQPIRRAGLQVGFRSAVEDQSDQNASWIPGIRVEQLSDALHRVREMDGSVIWQSEDVSSENGNALVRDSNGVHSYLVAT
ncbi:MAG: VOC family protein [Ruegeria sp.]